jgi:hypothetical protein
MPDARCGKLDGKRQAIQARADCADQRRSSQRGGEVGADGARPLDEQLYRLAREHLRRRRTRGRQGHARDADLMLTGQPWLMTVAPGMRRSCVAAISRGFCSRTARSRRSTRPKKFAEYYAGHPPQLDS